MKWREIQNFVRKQLFSRTHIAIDRPYSNAMFRINVLLFLLLFLVLRWSALTSPYNTRSKEGCCICGAKSQKGSPFRQTGKIECYLVSVFGLAGRSGDNCNACFSRVSRWRRNNTRRQSNLTNLPPGCQVSRKLVIFHFYIYHIFIEFKNLMSRVGVNCNWVHSINLSVCFYLFFGTAIDTNRRKT